MAKPSLNSKFLRLPTSPIRGFPQLKTIPPERLISLGIGAVNYPAPQEIVKPLIVYARQALKTANLYGSSQGDQELRQALVYWYYKKYKIKALQPTSFLIGSGSSELIPWVMEALLPPGSEVLIPEPYYAYYSNFATALGISLVPIPTSIKTGFSLPAISKLKASTAKAKKIRAILLTSPNNPTGSVISKSYLTQLVQLAKEKNWWIIEDSAYSELYYQKHGPVSILSLPAARERTVVLSSVSKNLALAGWRVGWVVSLAQSAIDAMVSRKAEIRGCASVPVQRAVSHLNQVPVSYFNGLRRELKARRNSLFLGLKKMASLGVIVSPQPPVGALYIVVRLPFPAEAFVRWCLSGMDGKSGFLAKHQKTVFCVPMVTKTGSFFISLGDPNLVRLSFGGSHEQIKQAIPILRQAIKEYQSL
ncbi:pyridoxal phosphate-dependent aminotransferase [Patescibacteria group bacterium]|nr:pyridoxal phosphate-dependent aminotransferase [Patescibacteria group bacterium]MBU1931921.1 pyridoxal phosphate-dependent aminotransferase [Patescibacteria group bacterium]